MNNWNGQAGRATRATRILFVRLHRTISAARNVLVDQFGFDLPKQIRECQRIALRTKPYGAFLRGEPKWVHFDLVPTQAPRAFCLSPHFRPTESDGVHVAWDTGSNGHPDVGIPGKCVSPFEAGDWLVRVELDQQASR